MKLDTAKRALDAALDKAKCTKVLRNRIAAVVEATRADAYREGWDEGYVEGYRECGDHDY